MTHATPKRSSDAIEIPSNVKAQLGLDRERSWIVLTELNRFVWPGPDLRMVPGRDNPFYDMLPDWLFERVRDALIGNARAGRLTITKRTE